MKTAAAKDLLHAETALTWFALRVEARRPSITNAQLSLVRRSARPPVLANGSSGSPDVHYPVRAEFVVQDILLRAGIAAWVPVGSKWVRANKYRPHQKVAVYQPILPGYVLAALPPDGRGTDGAPVDWFRVLRCPLVRGVMGFGGAPAAIPRQGMDQLREVESEERVKTVQRLMPTGRTFEVGQEVEVLEGPLTWARGKVIEITEHEAKVIFKLFGADRAVSVPLPSLGSSE